ncbi:MAG: Lysine--tRNA ligase, partial [Chloroflexi bacterium]|nr:Lysine--tRNA ligase [Chloroflexota bacterium]
GGSRDRSNAIAREVFEREPPINVAYEFLNIGGRKMSTSKGRGAAAHRIVEVIPPEQLRTLFIRPRPNHAIEFDPEGTDAIPRLFDEFDKLADATAGRDVKGDLPPGFDAVFRYALRDPNADVAAEAAAFRPAFAHLAFLAQLPGADIPALMAAEKGSALTARELTVLDERLTAARAWLESYAPDRARMAVRADLPTEVGSLDAAQGAFLDGLAAAVTTNSPGSGDAWQAAIFAAAADYELPAGRAFAALYAAFLGRTNGPRAGWLLAGLDRAFVIDRLRAAAGATMSSAGGTP